MVLSLLCAVGLLLAPAQSYPLPTGQSGQTKEELFIIVVAEAPDEKIARTMALVIRQVVQRPVHLYRGDDRVMIILTGYPIPRPDAEIIGADLKVFDLFQDTPYPRFHAVESVDYCDQTRRCLELDDSKAAPPQPII